MEYENMLRFRRASTTAGQHNMHIFENCTQQCAKIGLNYLQNLRL